mgnify:CR=1 FL=1
MGRHTIEETSSSMRRFSRRAKIISGVFGASLALGTGVAVAAWLVTGSGTGSVSTQTINNLAVTTTGIGGLYPGASGTGNVTIWNTNGFPVSLTSDSITSDSPCYTVAIDSVAGQTLAVGSYQYSIGDGRRGGNLTITYTATMPATAGPSCSNVTLTPTVTVNGQVGA